MRRVLQSAWVALAAFLAACGGGGGGGSDRITVTWIPASLSASYQDTDVNVRFDVTVKLSKVPGDVAQSMMLDSGTAFGLQGVAAYSSDGGYTWTATLYPKENLAAGTYHGTLTLHLCRDAACSAEAPLSGNAFTYDITVTTKSAPAPACTVNSPLFLQGAYAVENNAYSNAALQFPVTTFEQCVYIAAGTGSAVDARWTWNWNTVDPNLHSYPEVEYGQKPWMDAPTTGAALPRKLGDIGAVTAHLDRSELGISPNFAGYQVLDLYVASDTTKPQGSDHLPVKAFVEVFLKSYGGQHWALPVTRANVAVGGCHWDTIYESSTGNGWPMIAYFPTSDCALSGILDLDVKPFLDEFRANEAASLLSDADYLTSLEFGTQIFRGSGELDLNDFQVTVTAP